MPRVEHSLFAPVCLWVKETSTELIRKFGRNDLTALEVQSRVNKIDPKDYDTYKRLTRETENNFENATIYDLWGEFYQILRSNQVDITKMDFLYEHPPGKVYLDLIDLTYRAQIPRNHIIEQAWSLGESRNLQLMVKIVDFKQGAPERFKGDDYAWDLETIRKFINSPVRHRTYLTAISFRSRTDS